MNQRIWLVAGAGVVSLGVAAALYAQQPGFTRKLLRDQNLSVSERHAVQVVAEFTPGGAAAMCSRARCSSKSPASRRAR